MTETETVITREEIEETMITERTTKEKVKAEAEATTKKENIAEEALHDLAIADFIIKAIKASRK